MVTISRFIVHFVHLVFVIRLGREPAIGKYEIRLLEKNEVQQTRWFRQIGRVKDKGIRDAVKDLETSLTARAQRDGDSIVLSMSCRDKSEAALIVNAMVDLFLASQGATKRAEVAEKLARLNEQRD